MAKLESLIDAFTAATVNTSVWGSSSVGQYALDTVNDLVTLNVGTTTGTYNSFGTNAFYDATNSSLYAEITAAPLGNGGVQTSLKLAKDVNNAIQLSVSGTSFLAQVVTAGSYATTPLPTYDPHAHRWWRFTESSGSFVLAASPDGLNWTTLATLPYTWSATAVQVYFQTGVTDTEPAGMVAAIQHVNTRLGGTSNPHWPRMEDAWGPYWDANAGSHPLDRYVDVTDRTRDAAAVSRGRQYELDQVRSGEASLKLRNTDAALDPVNASGPWAGHIQPYQPYRKRAQWPPTRNLLTQVQATGGDLGGYAAGAIPGGSSGIAVFSDLGAGTIVASSSAWQGGRVFDWVIAAGASAASRVIYTMQPGCVPGVTYTATLRVRNVAASGSQQVKPYLAWYTAGTTGVTSTVYGATVALAGSASAGWTTVTVTATAPASAAGMELGVQLAATSVACEIQADGWQLEKGATATVWQVPGVWYPMYAGWTERWSPSWDMAGTYGSVAPSAVDTFSLLSQQQLNDALTMELNANSPRFVYKLDDPQGSMSVADWTGNNPPAQLGISKYGAGSLVFGTEIEANDSTGTYTGSPDTVARISNAQPGTNNVGPATFISLGSAGITGPASMSEWTRMIAFRYTGPTPTTSSRFWSSCDRQRSGGFPSGSTMYWTITSSGQIGLVLRGPTSGGNGILFNPGPTVLDGNWHLALVGYNRSSATMRFHVDGTTYVYNAVDPTLEPSGLISDNVAAFVDPTVGNGTAYNFQGDISFVAEFPTQLSSGAMSNVYSAWKAACAGESTNARYARILRYAGYFGPQSQDAGLTTSMGPAKIDGQDAMSALENVVETENGAHYVGRDGKIVFRSRSARYNSFTPAYTLGERTDLGEWPYEDCQLDFDSTHLSNAVTVTQESTGQTFYAKDAASTEAYFPRTMSRTINSSSTDECQDAANYLLSRYRQPAQRVSSIKLHPSGNPQLWAMCLALELGTRVRVMRRPPGAPAIQVDCYVENIQWDLDDNGEAWCTLQCSPADLTPYGVFAAWHTTLNATVAAGVTTVTVNASQDNVNPLRAQLAPGQQIVLGQNTANQETVTVSSVGATSPGWTTATVTLTAATTKAHTAGDSVCELLPAGTTDPTTWDAVAQFDAVAFAY
ncbi:hypothetical protein ACIGMX_34415 [Streptomyces aquilus]|uniref:hypothetical protein n=1 Tax=Streptomyces aquilus TaxID=2548456 RepID=UPI0037CCE447